MTSDVVRGGAQEPIFDKAENAHFRGSLQGYWGIENLLELTIVSDNFLETHILCQINITRICRMSLLRRTCLFFVCQVQRLTHACCQNCISYTFELLFYESCHLDDPSLFEAYIRPPL